MNIVVDVSDVTVEALTVTILAREGRSMATKLVTQKAAPAKAKKAVAKKAADRKATPVKAKVSAKKGPAAPKAGKPKPSRSGLPAATRRALKELEAGQLNRYADADDLFRKLGIRLGQD
jgi:anti-sigma factor RsiW